MIRAIKCNTLFSLVLCLTATASFAGPHRAHAVPTNGKAVVCRTDAGVPVLAHLIPDSLADASLETIMAEFSLTAPVLGEVLTSSSQCSVEWVTDEVQKLAIQLPSIQWPDLSAKGTLGHGTH